MIATNFPIISTQRLILNQPDETDLETITEILNNKVYAENTLNIPFPYSKNDASFWIELARNGFRNEDQYIFAIRLKDNNQLIGGIDLGIDKKFNKAELGYWIDTEYWNNGYASEAAKAIIEFGFENLKLKRIFASHFDYNPSSGNVLKKIGMEKEGILKFHTKKNGEYQNHILYAIINE